MVPVRAILRRLDVSPHSFVRPCMYTEMYNTLFMSRRFVLVELVDNSCCQHCERFVAPFCPKGVMAVPVQFVFVSSRLTCSTTRTLPQICWDTCARSGDLYI